jgi:hypothetical protein
MTSIVMDIICILGGKKERDSGTRKCEYSVLVLTHLQNTSQKLFIYICNLYLVLNFNTLTSKF